MQKYLELESPTFCVAPPEPPKPPPDDQDADNPDYLEYVKRLQFRIAEFSNVKDSIDVRKSRRSKAQLHQSRPQAALPTPPSSSAECKSTPELMIPVSAAVASVIANSNGVNSPATSRKLEELTRERSKQKNAVQDLLMDKLEAHKLRSAEKRAKRAARTASLVAGVSPHRTTPQPPDESERPSIDNTPKGKRSFIFGQVLVSFEFADYGTLTKCMNVISQGVTTLMYESLNRAMRTVL